jgi:aryl-alcohol dehydrogenase-like predicted oxidoreductase
MDSQMLQNIAEKNGWHKFISMQNYYNLLYREEEREMIPYCKRTGVGLIPWSPIARGVLSRPWGQTSHREETETMMVLRSSLISDEEVVGRVEKLAKEKGVSMTMIASAWVRYKGATPIMGLNKKERIDEAGESLKVVLTEEEVKSLDEKYEPKMPFGHS